MKKLLAPLLAALALSVAPAALAADRGSGRSGDHDEALRAVEAREALPIARIMEIALRAAPGEIVEIELDSEDGTLIYEVEVLSGSGRVRKVDIDARTGAVLDIEDED